MAVVYPKKGGGGRASNGTKKKQRRRSLLPHFLQNLSFLSIMLGASALVTILTTVMNLHLLSQVMLHESSSGSSSGGGGFGDVHPMMDHLAKQQDNPKPRSGYLEDGTYWTDDEDNPSYIDVQNNEQPIENPPLANGNATFSACLLVMDDNHRLVEWLAYHYHVLPLRFLIITIDPRSRTKPTHVLNRWRRMGMHILEWNDFDFLKLSLAQHPIPDDARLEDKRARHRIRQRQFFRKCLQVSKTYDRSYVALVDTDEYIMYNHQGGDKFEAWEAAQEIKHAMNKDTKRHKRIRPSQVPPTPAEEGAMMQYIRQEEAAGTPFAQGPCISSPRLQIGAIETNDTELAGIDPAFLYQDKMADVVDTDRFETLRFRKHGPRQEFVNNRLAKCIIDVSRVEKFPDMETLHRPIKELCPPPWRNEWDSGLRVYHYLGTWEAYTFRDDARRGGEHSKELWYFKSAAFADESDDNIRPWLDGFVETHGREKAKELLHGVGLPRDFVNPIGHNYTYNYRHLHQIMNETKRNEGKKKEMQLAFDKFVLQMHNTT